MLLKFEFAPEVRPVDITLGTISASDENSDDFRHCMKKFCSTTSATPVTTHQPISFRPSTILYVIWQQKITLNVVENIQWSHLFQVNLIKCPQIQLFVYD